MHVRDEIKVLRQRLESLITGRKTLCEEDILECSRILDKLIDKYYREVDKNTFEDTESTLEE